ncbi:ParA family protein [Priestia megaterium]|uniref:ParA family protein n=1 Tax=Priestia megaterium TaxID=1404 RepID=UPI003F7FE2D0
MTKVICFSLQKGGVAKTTTTSITAYLLAEMGHKVLAVDFDSQGNLTAILTQQNIYDFTGRTVLEAIKENNAEEYTVKVTDNLHVLPANDYLATISKYLYRDYTGVPVRALEKALESIKDQYDYILIDTPPNLGDLTTNALTASDYVVIPYATDQWTFDALFPFMETVEYVEKNVNKSLKFVGILPRIIDSRVGETKDYLEALDTYLPNKRFETTIKSNAAARRLQMYGFFDNPEVNKAVKQYKPFLKELLERCQE